MSGTRPSDGRSPATPQAYAEADAEAAVLEEAGAVADLAPMRALPALDDQPAQHLPGLDAIKGLGAPQRPANLQYTAPSVDGGSGPVAAGPTNAVGANEGSPEAGQAVGHGPARNQPCPCGSGKKYKKCHGAPGT